VITWSRSANTGLIVGGVVVIVIAAAVYMMISKFQPTVSLRLGDGVFDARLAKTPPDRKKGLGGVISLDAKEALILAFPSDDEWGIWMKDMRFPIDIIWLDKDRKVVYIVKNASPEDSTNATFTPKTPARYVIEVAAGTVDSKTINIKQSAAFDINTEEVW
jgi:uncharacterized membrane protein (UPF0127 family)